MGEKDGVVDTGLASLAGFTLPIKVSRPHSSIVHVPYVSQRASLALAEAEAGKAQLQPLAGQAKPGLGWTRDWMHGKADNHTRPSHPAVTPGITGPPTPSSR